jgi:hypothetical protein
MIYGFGTSSEGDSGTPILLLGEVPEKSGLANSIRNS